MPTQKEVIHLTFGTLSHHITTHFFNQQSSHFQYPASNEDARHSGREGDDDGSPLLLDPGVDFQEGVGTRRAEQTFFPRQVVFDFRENFGTGWDAYDVVYDESAEEDATGTQQDDEVVLGPSRAANEGLNAWYSPAEIYRTGLGENVKSTRLGSALDGSDDDTEEDEEEAVDEGQTSIRQGGSGEVDRGDNGIRHRHQRDRLSFTPAAYAHNPHHPRSIRQLPRLFGGGSLAPMQAKSDEGNVPLASFEMGMNLSRFMESEESSLDERIRWFAEDSDLLQAFSLCTSTSDGFSGMAHEMLQSLADEYPKTPVLAWGADYDPQVDLHDEAMSERLALLRTTNNVLSLWSLSSASLFSPLRLPTQLQEADKHASRSHHLSSRINWLDLHNVGGLFSAYIDTATLTSRLHDERLRRSTATLVSTLNWRRDTPIAALGGCMPTPLLAPVAEPARPLDPIEALLAARGFDSRKNDRIGQTMESAEERARRAAQTIRKNFVSLTPYKLTDGYAKNRATQTIGTPYARTALARDDDGMAAAPTREALEAWTALDEPAGRADFVPLAFNVRSASFPQLFSGLTSTGRPVLSGPPADAHRPAKIRSLPMLASLSTTPDTASLLAEARRWVDSRIIKGHESLAAFGIGGARGRSGAGQAASDDTEGLLGGREGLMEVRERVEELLGAYEEGLPGGQAIDPEDDQMGTDEEYEAEGSDWELDG